MRSCMLIKKMVFPWITVSDIKKTKKFYVDVLGCKVHYEDPKSPEWLEVKCGDSVLGIWQADGKSPDRPGQNAILTFVTDDLDEAKKILEQQNVQLTTGIIQMPAYRFFSFTDGDGNKCQLYEMSEMP